MTKILFYVEPLIERGKPYWKEGWANFLAKKMASVLSPKCSCSIALNEPCLERLGDVENVNIIVFSQKELLGPFNGGYIEASSAWYMNSYSESQMQYYTELMENKFDGINFDLIITFTPVPFFAKLYPKALILHMEYSLFSRLPFLETWYLDPCGMYEHNFFSRFSTQIENIRLDDCQKLLIGELRETCVSAFTENNIFVDDMMELRKRYKYLVLLPMQFSQYYAFDCLSRYTNQFDYLTGVLEETSPDIGVIFTMHPEYPIFDEETVHFITSKYKNAIFLEKSRKIYAASQWLMPYIDAVVTVSSSVGLQTLLFGNKLFAIGNKNMNYIADAADLRDMRAALASDKRDKDAYLYFFVTKYAIPKEYLFDGDWLYKFLISSTKKSIDSNFYDNIADEKKLFETHIQAIKQNRDITPRWTVNFYEPIIYLLSLNKEYDESHTLAPIKLVFDGAIHYRARFILSDTKIRKLRFDPLEGAAAEVEIVGIKTDAKDYTIAAVNAIKYEGDIYTFITFDPIFEITGDFANASYIEFEYTLRILPTEEISRLGQEQRILLQQAKHIIAAKNDEIALKNSMIQEIKATRGYRVLEKIRDIKDKF